MLLELRDITKRYDAVDGVEAPPVLDGVSLDIEAGQSLSIVGPSGCGKSTLLNIIGTLDRPTSGSVKLEGDDLAKLDAEATAAVRNRKIGFIFQEHHLLPQCTVLENVLVPTLAGKHDAAAAGQRANQLLDKVGLTERAHHRPGQLSGGQRQRVAVVRALINQPVLLLADEPTGSLDRAAAENLTELLVSLNEDEGVTLIVVTHAMGLAERMGKVYELRDGKLGASGAA